MRMWHEKISIEASYPVNIIVSEIEEGYPTHWHQELEVIYVLEGELAIDLNNTIYSLKPRDILFLNTCDIHRYIANPEGCKKIILQFGKPAFDTYSDIIFKKRFINPHIKPNDLNLTEYEDIHKMLEKNILEIYNEWTSRMEGYQLVIRARINDLAAIIIRRLPMKTFSLEERIKHLEQCERLDNVLKFIDEFYDTDITLKGAADLAGFSIFHFSRFFKEAMGVNFIDFLGTYRINKAMDHLKYNTEPITKIALDAGFNSIGTFNRIFKKVNGCTPTDYRAKIK